MLQAVLAKFAEKQNLVKEANEKLKNAEAMVVKAKQEAIAAELDCNAAKLEVEKYQSQATSPQKIQKSSGDFTIGSKRIQGTQGTKRILCSRQSDEPKRRKIGRPKISNMRYSYGTKQIHIL